MSVTSEEKMYQRSNVDVVENQNGSELIKLMNGFAMIVLSGLVAKIIFTCINEMKKK